MTKIELNSSAIATCTACRTGIIYYDNRPAGAGKTHAEIDHIIDNPGLYLFACDRREAISERGEKIRSMLASRQCSLHIEEIMSSDREIEAKRRSVKIRVEALPKIYESGHVLAFITHAAMMDCDLSNFGGWTLVVDETPSVFESLATNSQVTWPILQQHFAIIPGESLNAIIPAAASSATNAEFTRDTMAREIAKLHRRVNASHFHVLTDTDDWRMLASEPTWRWTSIWSPTALLNFDRVIILANAFDRSLTKKVLAAIEPNIRWQRSVRPNLRRFKMRKMIITYFAKAHSASRGLFDKPPGRKHLGQIAGWLRKEVDGVRHIWACNDRDKDLLKRLPGEQLKPRMAGSNRYSEVDYVSILYTAKPDPGEIETLKLLNVDPFAAKETRELETIYQFVSRCSVRDPESERSIQVFVYDHTQARYLQEMFDQTDYVDVETQAVDLGFLDWIYESRSGPKKHKLSAQELEAKKEHQRVLARDRQRKRRAKLRD